MGSERRATLFSRPQGNPVSPSRDNCPLSRGRNGARPVESFDEVNCAQLGMMSSVNANTWKIAVTLMLGRAFAMFFTGIFGPLAPFLADEFGLTESQLGITSSAVYAGAVLMVLPMGNLVDKIGTRRPMIAGALLTPLYLLVLSRSTGLAMIIAVFFLSGLPRTLILPATEKAVAQVTTSGGRATIMGTIHSGPPLAGSLISALVPALAVALTWRTGVSAIGLVLIPLALWLRHMLWGLPLDDDGGDGQRAEDGSSALALLGDSRYLLPIAICAMFQGAHIVILSFYVLFMTDELLISPVWAGVLLGLAQMLAVATRPLWGHVSEQWFAGRRSLPLGIMGACGTAAIVALMMTPPGSSPYLLVPISLLVGAGIISARPMISTFAIEQSGINDAGKVSAMLLVATWSMFIIMPIVFGWTVTYTGSWTVGWLLTGALLVGGGVLPLVLRAQTDRSNGSSPDGP